MFEHELSDGAMELAPEQASNMILHPHLYCEAKQLFFRIWDRLAMDSLSVVKKQNFSVLNKDVRTKTVFLTT